ncbi:hypothetical protein LSTR_LSTR010029 [Laodelphax striatellus]|uniref:Uncharacterized protein n=1 Tax=Laodelphax striatellus TaxID=195883 RepID=A0A482XFP1_LAOST|nr:hypothetical protein LSTR_LSTR010029 [Laodelphax striatellus]
MKDHAKTAFYFDAPSPPPPIPPPLPPPPPPHHHPLPLLHPPFPVLSFPPSVRSECLAGHYTLHANHLTPSPIKQLQPIRKTSPGPDLAAGSPINRPMIEGTSQSSSLPQHVRQLYKMAALKALIVLAVVAACMAAEEERTKKDVVAAYPAGYGYAAYPYAVSGAYPYAAGAYPYSAYSAAYPAVSAYSAAYPAAYPAAYSAAYPYSSAVAYPKAYSAYPAAYSAVPAKAYPGYAYSGVYPAYSFWIAPVVV